MPSDRPPWLLLVVGVVLVANPLYVPVDSLSSPDHVYERAAISADGDVLEYESSLRNPIHGVDCFEDPGYRCTVERALVEENLTVASRVADGRSPDPFVALPGGWYRRVTEETDDGVRYRLERVPLSTVLREVSRPPSAVPERLRPAARGGRVTLESPIETTYVVRDDGAYYYLTETGTTAPPLGVAYPWLSVLGTLAGAVALVRAGRRRERYDRDR